MVETLFVICTCAAGSDANLFEGDILIPVSCILRFEKDPFAHWLFVCWDCWSSYSLLQGNISISDNKMCFIVCVALIRFMITVWVLTQHLFCMKNRKEGMPWLTKDTDGNFQSLTFWVMIWVSLSNIEYILNTVLTVILTVICMAQIYPHFVPLMY